MEAIITILVFKPIELVEVIIHTSKRCLHQETSLSTGQFATAAPTGYRILAAFLNRPIGNRSGHFYFPGLFWGYSIYAGSTCERRLFSFLIYALISSASLLVARRNYGALSYAVFWLRSPHYWGVLTTGVLTTAVLTTGVLTTSQEPMTP